MMDDEWPEEVIERAAHLWGQLQPAIDDFIRRHQLPDAFNRVIDDYYLPLAVWLAQQKKPRVTLVVGICGGQGSGKSTLTDFLLLAWREALQLSATGFSIDDIYLTKAERARLAESVHPLLATRGVPGTHDIPLGIRTIRQLCAGDIGEVAIPQFDKATDERKPVDSWPRHSGALDILLFEGWCVGARPWDGDGAPINRLEREEDAEGAWRNYVNAQLAGPYQQLFGMLDLLVMLKVPDMAAVLEWRRLQERKLRARSDGGMDEGEVERFVQHYERITRNLLAEMPARADCVLELGRDHQICGLRLN